MWLKYLIPEYFLRLIRLARYRLKFPNVIISPEAYLDMKANFKFGKNVKISRETFMHQGEIQVGDYTYIGEFCRFGGTSNCKIKIGKYCMISSFVQIIGGNVNFKKRAQFSLATILKKDIYLDKYISKADIKIGNDVWIGTNVVILSGVKIGDGAVIAAGSIVTRDVEDYAIVAGSPAKEIKKRFDSKEIERLKMERWWDWSEEKICEKIDWLTEVVE